MIKIPETKFLAVVTNDTKNNVHVFAYQTFKSRSEFPCYDCHSTWLLFIFFNIIILLYFFFQENSYNYEKKYPL